MGITMEQEEKETALTDILIMDDKERMAIQHKILDNYGITMDKDDPVFALSIINAWHYLKLSQQYIRDSSVIYGDVTKDLNVALDNFIEGLNTVINNESQETIQQLARMIDQGRSIIDETKTQVGVLDSNVRELLTARLAETDEGIRAIILQQVSAMSETMTAEAVKQVEQAAKKAARPWGSILGGTLTGAFLTAAITAGMYFIVIQPQQRTEQRIYKAQERALAALPGSMKETYKKLFTDEIRRVYTP